MRDKRRIFLHSIRLLLHLVSNVLKIDDCWIVWFGITMHYAALIYLTLTDATKRILNKEQFMGKSTFDKLFISRKLFQGLFRVTIIDKQCKTTIWAHSNGCVVNAIWPIFNLIIYVNHWAFHIEWAYGNCTEHDSASISAAWNSLMQISRNVSLSMSRAWISNRTNRSNTCDADVHDYSFDMRL